MIKLKETDEREGDIALFIRWLRINFLIFCGALLLTGCAGWKPASVEEGECKVFDDPGFAVQGKRLKDKQWIGRTQEKGITVCDWKRPTR